MSGAVFLSAGIPDPSKPHYVGPSDPIDVIEAVKALVYVVLGRRRLVWGGHPAITPIVWSVAASHRVDYAKWVTLYQSRYFADRFPEDNKRFSNTRYVDPVASGHSLTEKDIENASLRHMRQTMFAENIFETAVFIGGMEGIFEEYDLFGKLCPAARRIPILSTGGAALGLRDRLSDHDLDVDLKRLIEDVDYIPLLFDLCRIHPSELRDTDEQRPGQV